MDLKSNLVNLKSNLFSFNYIYIYYVLIYALSIKCKITDIVVIMNQRKSGKQYFLSQNSILFFMWLQITVLLADCCQYHELTPELCPKKMPVLYTHVSKS